MSESKLSTLVEAMAATELITVCERHGILPAYVQIRMGLSVHEVDSHARTWDHGPMTFWACCPIRTKHTLDHVELLLMRGEGATITEAVDCLMRRLNEHMIHDWRETIAQTYAMAEGITFDGLIKIKPRSLQAWKLDPARYVRTSKPAQLTIVPSKKEPNNE